MMPATRKPYLLVMSRHSRLGGRPGTTIVRACDSHHEARTILNEQAPDFYLVLVRIDVKGFAGVEVDDTFRRHTAYDPPVQLLEGG